MTFAGPSPLTLPLCLAAFFAMLGLGMLAPALPQLTAGQSELAQGIAVSAFGLARLFVTYPAGLATDRLGPRRTALAGLLILMAGSLIGYLVPGFAAVVTAIGLQGMGSAIFSTSAMTALLLEAGPDRRGAVMSWFQTAFLMSFALGPIIGGYVIRHLGDHAPFLVQATLGLTSLAVVPLLGNRGPGTRLPGGPALLTPALRGGAAIAFANFLARTVVSWVLVPAVAIKLIGLDTDRLGLIIGVATAANFLTLPVTARLIDGWGAARTVHLAMVCAIASLVLLYLAPNEPGLWIGTMLAMIATGAVMPAATVAAMEGLPREAMGRGMGVFRMAGDLGMAIGPIAVTATVRATGAGMPAGFLITAIIMLAATLVFAAFRRVRPRAG